MWALLRLTAIPDGLSPLYNGQSTKGHFWSCLRLICEIRTELSELDDQAHINEPNDDRVGQNNKSSQLKDPMSISTCLGYL